MSFLGEYEINMDAKGRVSLPAGFKKQLAEGQEAEGFVVCRGMESCLSFYTKAGWDKVTAKLNRLNDFNPKVQQLKRILLSGASLLELDSAGRILMPKPLQEYAGLEKEIVLTAQGDKLEIWDKAKYHDYLNKYNGDLEKLANEVLGNQFIDPFEE